MKGLGLSVFLPALVFGSLCLIWGATPVAVRLGLRFLPPFFFGGIRVLIAWGLVTAYALATRTEFPRDGATWRIMLFLGLSQTALPYALVYWAQQYVTAGLTTVLLATTPFFVMAFAHFLTPDERVNRWNLLGMLLSFIGVTILFLRSELSTNQNSYLGGFALIGASGICGWGMVIGKKYSTTINTTANITVQMGVGALILTTAGILFETAIPLNLNLESATAIIFLALVSSALGYAAMYWLFRRMDATRFSLNAFVTPVVAIALAWLILGEKVDPNVVAGGSLILLGLLMNKTT
jgi:drug/metabolite transporter (DMT)-like permease